MHTIKISLFVIMKNRHMLQFLWDYLNVVENAKELTDFEIKEEVAQSF